METIILKKIDNMITKDIIPDLFTFPIVMVDGENEESKKEERDQMRRLGIQSDIEPEEVGYDIVYGQAAYPYYDFRGVEDRWLPTHKSLQRALRKKFDSCLVRFDNAGSFLVPMPRDQFLSEITQFVTKRKNDITIQYSLLKNDDADDNRPPV